MTKVLVLGAGRSEVAALQKVLESHKIEVFKGEKKMIGTSIISVIGDLFEDQTRPVQPYSYPRYSRGPSGAASAKRSAAKRRNIRARSKK